MPFDFGLGSAFVMIGLPLVGIPIVIHLINMMRHNRVEWAAMEFLLESQRRNSRWIILKQLLLLLLRMLAVAAVVFVLAQTQLKNELGELLGSSRLHHVVLLDDSLSMSDQFGEMSAFERARRMVEKLGDEAVRQPGGQSFTLLPFSRAAARDPVLRERSVDRDRFRTELEESLRALSVTQTNAGPLSAVESIQSLLGEAENERRVFYVVSDFRTPEWDEPGDLAKALSKLAGENSQLKLIDCVEAPHHNLAITNLVPVGGTRAAGVPLEMQIDVRNYGTVTADRVAVKLNVNGREDRLLIDRIEPGQAETKRFEVRLFTAGEHQVSAALDKPDAIEGDNTRFAVVDVSVDVPVLILDSEIERTAAYFVSRALFPEGPVSTGIAPVIEPPSFLADNEIDRFRAVFLLNADNLDSEWVAKLEKYVAQGGGLGIFLGRDFRDGLAAGQLFRDGAGLLPLPITEQVALEVESLEKAPDVEFSDHFIFHRFQGPAQLFLQTVTVLDYFEIDSQYQPPPEARIRTLAKLRNGSPFALEKPFGKGRVVCFLSSAAPEGNDWARNPSFPVVIHELQTYLTSSYAGGETRLVGSPVRERLRIDQFQETARLIRPGESEASTAPFVLPLDEKDAQYRVANVEDTDAAGVYQLKLTDAKNQTQTRLYAMNVAAEEGNLKKNDEGQLRTRLPGLDFVYSQAAEFSFGAEVEGFNLTDLILYLLIFVLIGEQLLSYVVSYHPPVGASR